MTEIHLNKLFSFSPCEAPTNVELSLAKSLSKSDGEGREAKRGWIEGWMTVEKMDTDGDISRANGGHYDILLKKGFFQYEHPSLAHNIVGRPVSCEVGTEPIEGKPGVLCRGFFYLKDKYGQILFEKSQMLAESEPDDPYRRLAMSMEGKGWNCIPYIDEPGGRWDIRKWRPHSIAITHRPKVETARIPGQRMMDIAMSLTVAEEAGTLPDVLSALANNHSLMKSLLESDPDDVAAHPDEDHIQYAMRKHSLTRDQATLLVTCTHQLLA